MLQTITQQASVESTYSSAQELANGLKALNTMPLWTQMKKLNPPLPNPTCVPHVWKYGDIRPSLLAAGELVTEKEAERRVLMLVNPAREAPYTTDTIYGGLQLVMPGEVAKAHRHTAFAMRFIIEGQGGFSAIQGSRVNMKRGDVILTPSWNWHDHGKDGSGPMIWLDGLDLPSFRHFPVHFVEHYEKDRFDAEVVDSDDSPLVFPWERMQASLDAAGGDWVSKPYLKANGKPVSRTLSGTAERLNAGCKSPVVRETSSAVYHVIAGSGHSRIGDKDISWVAGDTFCIPSWYEYQHFASAQQRDPVYLYRFDDKPMLLSLGLYRAQGCDDESLVAS